MGKKRIKEMVMKLLDALCQSTSSDFSVQKNTAANFVVLGELADILVNEFGAKRLFLDAASESNDGTICIDTEEIIFERGCSHPFFRYIKYANFLNFSATSDGLLRITFGVKNLIVKER